MSKLMKLQYETTNYYEDDEIIEHVFVSEDLKYAEDIFNEDFGEDIYEYAQECYYDEYEILGCVLCIDYREKSLDYVSSVLKVRILAYGEVCDVLGLNTYLDRKTENLFLEKAKEA